MRKKVVCAMSGGVDSSVAALLLMEQGYDVIGITLQIWDKSECGEHREKACCSLQDIEDARRVCAKLGMPFYVLNAVSQFKQAVIDYFCDEYKNGRTPNPCIACNDHIKFGLLLERAKQLGADYIATGHYARIEFDKSRNRYILKEGIDKQKDQSYVLFGLTQAQLSKTLFPLGELTKPQVKELAKKNRLATSQKPESQDICFIREDNYAEYLKKKVDGIGKEGNIRTLEGEIIGRHKGIAFYTIGQREGLGIALGKPMYVTKIDAQNNEIFIGDKESLEARELVADRLNWISVDGLTADMALEAKIRYLNPKKKAVISKNGHEDVSVRFLEPQSAITPGQAVVFYDGDAVVGGGWIK